MMQPKPLSETGITCTVEDGKLVIKCPLDKQAKSSSGENMLVASTRGNRTTGVKVNGKEVILGLNAYYPL